MPKAETSLKELLHEVRRIEEHREVLTENKIQAIYRDLEKSLNAYLAEEYVKYADADGRFYLSYLDAQNKKARFLKEIANNVDGFSPKTRKAILNLVDETYAKSYSGMVDALKEAEKNGVLAEVVKDISVQPDVLAEAVNNNISKLTLPSVLEKHRNEIIYDIQQTLVIGLMNGDRYETMSKRISERLGVSKSKAKNIVRTESHRNIENGFMDCAEHIQEGMKGSEYIYAATWHNMGDERVRPQQRYKTKKGWKTVYSKNGANHIVLEGQTVKAGELFDLGNYNGRKVTAKNPSRSGIAAHDCNCRCFLEYNLMTIEEFEKATGKTTSVAAKHYEKSVAKEPKITADLQRAVENTGGELTGLDYRLKTESSYNRKVEKEIVDINKEAAKRGIKYSATQADAVGNMRDVVRYTSLSSKETLVDDFNDIVKGLEKDGYSLVRVKNTFKPDAPYKGINCILQDADGYCFELQFHTPQSFELKNGILHELYEKERLVTTSAAEKAVLQKQMKEISDSIVFPDNVDSISSFNNIEDILDKIEKKKK